jgi:hypothetical protein
MKTLKYTPNQNARFVIQIRNKFFTSQNTTSIADIYFISFKVRR